MSLSALKKAKQQSQGQNANQQIAIRGVVVDLMESPSPEEIKDNGKGLELQGTVTNSYVPGIKEGQEINFRITAGGGKDADTIFDNLEKGSTSRINMKKLVLENCNIAEDGVLESRWAHKAGGMSREVDAAYMSEQIISFSQPFLDDEGNQARKQTYIRGYGQQPDGSSREEKAQLLQQQLQTLQKNYASSDSNQINKNRIQVFRDAAYTDKAELLSDSNNDEELLQKIGEAHKNGHSQVNVRYFDDETREALVIRVHTWPMNENNENPRSAQEVFANAAAYALQDSDKAELFDKFEDKQEQGKGDCIKVETIPGDRVRMPFNMQDFKKNASVMQAQEYLSMNDNQRNFLEQVDQANKVKPMIAIRGVYKKDGVQHTAGALKFIPGDTSQQFSLDYVPTPNFNPTVQAAPKQDAGDEPREKQGQRTDAKQNAKAEENTTPKTNHQAQPDSPDLFSDLENENFDEEIPAPGH